MNAYVLLAVLCFPLMCIGGVPPQTISASSCGELGRWCDRTIFHPCCDGLVCRLEGFANGKCVKCLENDFLCLANSECCSGYCYFSKCVSSSINANRLSS
uniref:UPF0506 domain-containing protein n=1 Tax=Trichobilharzia regenti TaxID=157069 RepID=A0AA85J185_TRIRE|nr:unnamed protein product [Trichobilharzia regenti]